MKPIHEICFVFPSIAIFTAGFVYYLWQLANTPCGRVPLVLRPYVSAGLPLAKEGTALPVFRLIR